MSAFFIVEGADKPEHFRDLAQALARFLQLLIEGNAEDITLRFSS